MNVLVPPLRHDVPEHRTVAPWLASALTGGEPVGAASETLSAVLRIATNRKVWPDPTPLGVAIEYVERLRAAPAFTLATPGDDHWPLFLACGREIGATGADIPDAWLAALAIEHEATLVTLDRGFARFRQLRWTVPPRG